MTREEILDFILKTLLDDDPSGDQPIDIIADRWMEDTDAAFDRGVDAGVRSCNE